MVRGRGGADACDHGGELRCAAIVEVVAVDRGDDDVGEAHAGDGFGHARRLVARRRGPGSPVFTLQKAQARVQVSPRIMKVACFFDQHSPMFGQPASSQTVTSLPCAHDLARFLVDRAIRAP